MSVYDTFADAASSCACVRVAGSRAIWSRWLLGHRRGCRVKPRRSVGITYLRALDTEESIKRSDLAKAMVYNFAFALTSIAGPNVLLKNRDSPYRFTEKQMGPHLPGGSAA